MSALTAARASSNKSGFGFECWAEHFRSAANSLPTIPWSDEYRLTDEERAAITPSIQQFQLGEGAEGKHFQQRAMQFCERQGETHYPAALALFIAEEQRHSADLARFMESQDIPRLERHWVDGGFRRLRKLAGLELCVVVLVTAEVIAVPYYRALQAATNCPTLIALCGRILKDEASHLQFQADALAMLRETRGAASLRARLLFHKALLLFAASLVWRQHGTVFRRAGYTRRQLREECFRIIRKMYRRVHHIHA
jgi:hypothetical protein